MNQGWGQNVGVISIHVKFCNSRFESDSIKTKNSQHLSDMRSANTNGIKMANHVTNIANLSTTYFDYNMCHGANLNIRRFLKYCKCLKIPSFLHIF